MKLNRHYQKKEAIVIRLLSLIFLIILFTNSYTRALTIRGKVTASRYCVQYAAVTFIDTADTTKRFSALTNDLGCYQIDILTSVEFNTNDIPDQFELAQNYPNPFSSVTAIPYILDKRTDVQITIYDILGREVREFTLGNQAAGSHQLIWDGRNSVGNKVANGIYFYQLQTEHKSRVKKMILSSSVGGSLSFYQTVPLQLSKMTGQSIQGGNYGVRIANTDNTFPVIISKQFDNIPIKNDTTINFDIACITSVVVNLDSVHQYIRGFGAANILQWRPDMTADEVYTAFGTGPGQIGFSILRLRVPYNLTESSMSIQIPTAKLAQSLGAIVFASPWTPPAAMKTNNNIVGGELKESCYNDYAAHLNKFAQYMADHGAPLYAISIQNEPDIRVTYESCDWSPAQMVKFLKENAASICTRIIAPESFQFLRPISDAILNDSAACANLDIVGGHIYGGGIAPYPLAVSKGKEIWMTEHLDTDTSWTANLATGVEISRCMTAGMNAYVWWYLVRFYGPIYDNESHAPKGTVSKRGYVMSQFARFVRPGYYRVECQILPWSNTLYVTAYKDSLSSKAVIVAVNTGSAPLDLAIRIQNGSMNLLTPYTTTECKNCIPGDDIHSIDNRFTFQLEASSITTFVSK